MTKKIVKLIGGLGNQMFQYAFAYALAKKFGTKIILDMSWFDEVIHDENVTTRTFELDVFNIDYEIAAEGELGQIVIAKHRSKIPRLLWKLFKIKKYMPRGNAFLQSNAYDFDKNLLEDEDYVYYDGYFQSENYFKDVREELLKSFSSKILLDEKNQTVLDKIIETNSVSIHVRRGDYVTLDDANKFHGTCSLEYYQNAIEHIAKKVPNPHFFLFSDDIEWVIKNLKIDYPFTVVDFNQGKGWLDLNLMKHCKHNILANSSFSWWGAWLNENSAKVVVAPKRWHTKKFKKCDIVPKAWVKL